jgi:protein ImuB
MLWIALYLPDLPLQSVEARLFSGSANKAEKPSAEIAHVIAEGPDTRPVLCAVNAHALSLGIHPGHTVAMARALTSTLIVTPRNPAWENEALARVATIACQFTPNVALDEECVLLEVSSSLTLFGGLEKLLSKLRIGMRSSGYHAHVGIAPTPLAALLMARRVNAAQTGMPCVMTLDELPGRLADLPLALFNWHSSTLKTLSQLGITRIRDLGKLPRGGVSRRFGTQILGDLDRALGRQPDPRNCFKPPEHFCA